MSTEQNKTETINISLSNVVEEREKLKSEELKRKLLLNNISGVEVTAKWVSETGKWAVSLSGQGNLPQEAGRLLASLYP